MCCLKLKKVRDNKKFYKCDKFFVLIPDFIV